MAPVGEDGSVGIRSVLIARAGGLVSAADLERFRVAILPPQNIAGYQLPLATLSLPGGPLTGSEPFLIHAEVGVRGGTHAPRRPGRRAVRLDPGPPAG